MSSNTPLHVPFADRAMDAEHPENHTPPPPPRKRTQKAVPYKKIVLKRSGYSYEKLEKPDFLSTQYLPPDDLKVGLRSAVALAGPTRFSRLPRVLLRFTSRACVALMDGFMRHCIAGAGCATSCDLGEGRVAVVGHASP